MESSKTNQKLKKGIKLFKQKKFVDSLTFFLSLPEDNDIDNIELAYYIGLCYASLERYEDALLYIEQVVTAEQENNRVLQCRYLLGVIYSKIGKKRMAEFEFNKLLEKGYKVGNVLSSLAYIAWQQQDVEQSLDYYKKALEADPQNSTALNGMGYVLACQNKELSKALSYCKKALDLQPSSAACLDSVGWVYYKLGLKSDAEKYLKQALQQKPDNPEILEHIKIAQVG